MTRPLRIAILTHSTNPRGGVVHALQLGEALTRLGHHAVVHAPGRAFFRAARCATLCVPATQIAGDTLALVRARIADYVAHVARSGEAFDVWHAQDGISGNALTSLTERGTISGYVRTVHHVDDFADPALAALQQRAIVGAGALLTVSRLWHDWLRDHGHTSTVVGNGVDTGRYTPLPDAKDTALRARLGAVTGPVFVAIGGVEERKNTLRLLEAFAIVRRHVPATLVLAGGASLLDHGAYQARFAAALADSGLEHVVLRTGPLPDALMPALYRAAATLVCASLLEGFGLTALEAMASGTPAVVSRVAPFTEYLGQHDAVWCDPASSDSIAQAMLASLDPIRRAGVVARGHCRAKGLDWDRVARAHLPVYAAMTQARVTEAVHA